jgi:hypothetical protein
VEALGARSPVWAVAGHHGLWPDDHDLGHGRPLAQTSMRPSGDAAYPPAHTILPKRGRQASRLNSGKLVIFNSMRLLILCTQAPLGQGASRAGLEEAIAGLYPAAALQSKALSQEIPSIERVPPAPRTP